MYYGCPPSSRTDGRELSKAEIQKSGNVRPIYVPGAVSGVKESCVKQCLVRCKTAAKFVYVVKSDFFASFLDTHPPSTQILRNEKRAPTLQALGSPCAKALASQGRASEVQTCCKVWLCTAAALSAVVLMAENSPRLKFKNPKTYAPSTCLGQSLV